MRRALIGLAILATLGAAPAFATHEKQDFNGDGFGDLAVGAPGEDVGKVKDAGAVNVIYGSPAGPAAAGNQFWHQNSSGIADSAEAGDAFGSALDVADLNGDGYADLVIGVPGEDLPGKPDNGAVHILFGSPAGLRAVGSRFYSDFSAVYETIHGNRRHAGAELEGESPKCASAITHLDFELTGGQDVLSIVVGCPGADRGKKDSGAAVVLSAAVGSTLQVLAQGEDGILGVKEKGDGFGGVLETGDFNGDGLQDLAVGVPFEDIGKIKDAGALNVIFGGASEFNGAGNQFIHQNASLSGTPVSGQAKKNEYFATALTGFALLFDPDFVGNYLLVGAPGEAKGFGGLNVFGPSAQGLVDPQVDLGPALNSVFEGTGVRSIGAALSAIDTNYDGDADVFAVGAPSSSPNPAFHEAGAVLFMTVGAGLEFQISSDFAQGAGSEVYLGANLLALDATDSFFPQLFASAPGYSDGAGQVFWLSLQTFGGAFAVFDQDTPGIKDTTEKWDLYGVLGGTPYLGVDSW